MSALLSRFEKISLKLPAPPASEPSEPKALPTGARRLRPSAVPIWFLYDTGRLILGLIPLLVVGGGLSPVLLLVGLFMLISPAIKYSRFRYDILGNTLVVEGGFISRWRRVIPRERVQSIDVVEKLRHRAFGVVELRIEAVGGKQTEAALVALLPDEADRIRHWASGGIQDLSRDAAAQDTSPTLARLTGSDLLLAGITGGRVAVLAALIGYGQEVIGENSFDAVTTFAGRLLPGASLVVVISLLVALTLALSLLFSIALTILIYWDFTLRLEDNRLVITRGLLERRRAQIPLRRVQAIQVDENIVRRWLGLASLTVVVAGYSSEGQENEESSVLLPLGRREKAWRVAGEILGAPNLASDTLERSPSRAVFRAGVLPGLLGLTAGTVARLFLGGPGAAVYLVVPLSWTFGWLLWRCREHGLVPGYVLIRSGFLVRRTSVVPEANIQHLQLTWSILQRALRLATVKVHIPGTHRRASDLKSQDARHWFRHLGEQGSES